MTLLSPNVSIVITAFNRNDQLTETLVSIAKQFSNLLVETIVVDDSTGQDALDCADLCLAGGVRYLRCNRPASSLFRNPALPTNIGIRAARGSVLILQNAECAHQSPTAIRDLTAPVLAAPPSSPVATFAHVTALDPAGAPVQDYCSPAVRRPYFFCGAVRRDLLTRLRGMDEDYWGAGYDDDDLAARLAGEGCQFLYLDVPVHHQWHPPAGDYSSASAMRQLFDEKCAAMLRGELGTVRNLGREWGGQP